jgi:outer membrane protein assembly factor BamE (lipoprotein component of BamABCDE complex)
LGVSLLILLAFAPCSCVFIGATALRLRPDDFRLGIGDPKQAGSKVQEGMTMDQVRSLLGSPHGRGEDHEGIYWTYRCDFFGGTLFRVHFGPDDRVTRRDWWVQ